MYIYIHIHVWIYICICIYLCMYLWCTSACLPCVPLHPSHVHLQLCIHTRKHIRTYIYICIHIYAYTFIYMCIYIYIYTYVWIYIHIYVFTYIHIYIYIYVYTYIYIYICIYYILYTLIYPWHTSACLPRVPLHPSHAYLQLQMLALQSLVQFQRQIYIVRVCEREKDREGETLALERGWVYRVAKIHKVPCLDRSFSAKEPYN